MRKLATALLLMGLLAEPVAAQQRQQPARPATPAPAQPPAPPEPPPAIFEPLLIQLSEILGALTFLTELCKGETGLGTTQLTGEAWRQRMRDLLEAEAHTAGQKERYAGAFNRGYSGYATTYRACTPAGKTAIERLLQDGARIAKDLSNRFGS